MLAYVFWHTPAAGVERAAYERELTGFHRSLSLRPPSGYRGSCAFRADAPPWRDGPAETEPAGTYEDWYLIDGWGALGVLEEAAVSRGHLSLHDAVARHAASGAGSVYRLREGQPELGEVRASVWVSRPAGQPTPGLTDLLADGIDPRRASLWRRCLALGPAPEHCLLGDAELATSCSGISPERLPAGWSARLAAREPLGEGSFSPTSDG
jgi:hypothetical protein